MGGGGVKNKLTPSDDEDRVHAGVILEGAGEQAVQVVALTPAHQYCTVKVLSFPQPRKTAATAGCRVDVSSTDVSPSKISWMLRPCTIFP
jgi:hypothetical protein